VVTTYNLQNVVTLSSRQHIALAYQPQAKALITDQARKFIRKLTTKNLT